MFQRILSRILLGIKGVMHISDDISPTDERIKALASARPLATASELNSFIGLASFSAMLIENYASKVAPLRELARTKGQFIWLPKHQEAFKIIRQSLTSNALAYFDRE